MNNFCVLGISHKTCPIEIRNKFTISIDNIKAIYEKFTTGKKDNVVILSTCNRTEIYSTLTLDSLIKLFEEYSEGDIEEFKPFSYFKSNDESIKHLFRVVSGIDSQILGDYEIIGQLKSTFSLAQKTQELDGVFQRIFYNAIQVSKLIKKETSISNGTTTVSYAVVHKIKNLFKNTDTNICVLGMGKIGTLTLKNIIKYLPNYKVNIVNRSIEKLQSISSQYNIDSYSFENIKDGLKEAEIIVVATGSDKPIINTDTLKGSKVSTIFDLSVPSNVSKEVQKMNNIRYYNVDDLSKIVDNTIKQREAQIPKAIRIIDNNILELKEWYQRKLLYGSNA